MQKSSRCSLFTLTVLTSFLLCGILSRPLGLPKAEPPVSRCSRRCGNEFSMCTKTANEKGETIYCFIRLKYCTDQCYWHKCVKTKRRIPYSSDQCYWRKLNRLCIKLNKWKKAKEEISIAFAEGEFYLYGKIVRVSFIDLKFRQSVDLKSQTDNMI